MALSPGTRFGPYEITDQIGAGGMGVVYRATDTNLKRDVAIKVLPETLAGDADRLTRFQREAELLASLNHPNIAQIYGLEKADSTTALVMELIEGPTLADRIEQGALPADEALGVAMQIAEALEAAHGQGIIHRDLKPANIKLRPDGTVKVLDFGIAKALEPDTITTEPQSPMLTTPATLAGVILGTAAYMSPEQARGRQVDQRADIWAFGCVLYEMLTGQPVFGGEDVTITLARVLERETDFDSLPAVLSPSVRHTIELCLQKDVRRRVADIRDVRLALQGEFDMTPPQVAEVTVVAQPAWRRVLPSSAAALVAAVITALIVWVIAQPDARFVKRFDYDLPPGQAFRGLTRAVVAFSPDGRHFVYNTTDGLYLRTMGELEPRLIPGTEPILTSPTFSPDSQAVAYWDFSVAELKRVAISGGAPVVIAPVETNVFGLSWGADGTILFAQPEGIYRVSANGGAPELVIPAEEGAFVYGPRLLPDGDSVLFTEAAVTEWDAGRIVAQSLSTGERTVLIEGGSDARYLPTGHLMYAFGDGLFAVAFDPDTLTVSGGAVPLAQGVVRSGGFNAAANFGVANNGTLIYATGNTVAAQRTLVWVDRTGREELLGLPPRAYNNARISPDGTTVALDVRDQDLDIWLWDLARATLTRLTFDPGEDEFPVWSPDSRRVAFSSSRGGGSAGDTAVFWRAADGTGSVERLAEGDGQMFPTSFLPDGTGILLFGGSTGGVGGAANDDISTVRLEGEDQVTPMLATIFQESYPAVSPDGRWLAYVSDESGSDEVYVRPYPDIDSGRWQVSTGGGTQPLWSRDGQELFYRSEDGVMAVAVETDPSFSAENPESVFEGDYLLADGGPNYDVSPNGERFLMIGQPQNIAATPQIIVVLDWFEELRRLAPID